MPIWVQQRIPSITRNALNDTAEDAVGAEIDKIKGVFDRPTPFTQRAVVFPRALQATRQKLVATIMLRDQAPGGGTPPDKYLLPEMRGGARQAKPFEKRLRQAGVMDGDEFAVPSRNYKVNAYGNLPNATIVAILSQVTRVGPVKESDTARHMRGLRKAGVIKDRRRLYFVPARDSALRRGVYERIGNRIRVVLIFVRQPTYSARFTLGEATRVEANKVFASYWQREFYRELQKAMGQSSARGQLG